MSWPAVGAYGPSWPHPVMRPYTRRGLRARQTSGPSPSRSVTPGRKPSTSASARSTRRSTVATPSGCLRSTPMDRRPRLKTCGGGTLGSPPTTESARSTRTTSAPKSARTMAQNGPGPIPESSMTRTPVSGPDGARTNGSEAAAGMAGMPTAAPPVGSRRAGERGAPLIVARAPGRVNLIGDHTDYSGGLVCPMAIDLATVVRLEAGGDRVELTSGAEPEAARVPLDVADPAALRPAWARYVGGVVAVLRPSVGGVGMVQTTLPVGAGLSSSAALE